MVTFCKQCHHVVEIPSDRPPFSIWQARCSHCGQAASGVVMLPDDRVARPTGRRAFPWLPEFPPAR
jgi:hypothetical protein